MMEAKKHSYGGRQCMACGGMACNVSYEELRKQVEERGKAPMGDVRAGVDSKPSIAKGMMAPLGRMAEGGTVSSTGGGGGDLDYHPDEDKVKKMLQGAFGASEAKAEETPPAKKAEGGEVEGPADGDDEMLMDQCASECMEAIEKKDKSAFKDALQVLVSDMLRKLG